MAVDQLASIEDVKAALGRDLTVPEENRVEAILDKVSELFRLHSGQQFTQGVSESVLIARGGVVTLPQRPVGTVTAVSGLDGTPLSYTLSGSRVLVAGVAGPVIVAYSHGGDIPELVRLTVADVAQKVLTVPLEAQAGVQQSTKSTGPFSETYTYASWTLGGQATLSPEDKRIAESYRVQTGRTIYVGPGR